MNRLTLLTVASLFLVSSEASANAPQYEAQLIRRPDGNIPLHAPVALNDQGQILLDAFSRAPYIWDTDKDSLFLAVPAWETFNQIEVANWNGAGQMCGTYIEEAGNPWLTFFWDGSSLQELNPKGIAIPRGVNDQGLVYGWLNIFGSTRAATWNGGGDATNLGHISPYPEETWSQVHHGNNTGDLVGVMKQNPDELPDPRAVMWQGGANPIDLGAPPTSTDGTTEAWSINDSLWIVGATTGDDPGADTGKAWHAHIWRQGEWTDIHDNTVFDPAGNGHFSVATTVNNGGTVAGHFISGFGPVYTAFVWCDSQMYVIDDLIKNVDEFENEVHIPNVIEINERGDILTGEYFLRRVTPSSATYVVNTTEDQTDMNPGDGECLTVDGNCSLRAAISEANAHVGRERIEFNIPEDDDNCNAGLCTITPNPELPIIQTPMVIDARTQPVYTGTPLIIIDGTESRESGADRAGFHITGDSIEVIGFSIGNWGKEGVLIEGDINKVIACYSGLHPDGETGIGNNGEGVLINGGSGNVIGGRSEDRRCVITNNGRGALENETTGDQIGIEKAGATDNRIEGCYIGTTASGLATLPNPLNGITLSRGTTRNTIGGDVVAARNVIAGHTTGVLCEMAPENFIQGNFIGLNAAGTDRLPNVGGGILVTDSRNVVVGGVAGITGSPPGNVVSGNRRSSRTIGHGVRVITGSHGALVQGNLIGTDATGRIGIGNEGAGVYIERSDSVLVGGAVLGAGNVIAANDSSGVLLSEATGVSIQGNGIGLDTRGRAPLPNGGSGIDLRLSENNLIGGLADFPGGPPGNVISGNRRTNQLISGIHVRRQSDNNTIQGNVVGLNRNGNGPLANGGHGIFLEDVDSTSVGALDERGRNVVSGNEWSGLYASRCTGTKIYSNYIGTNLFANADFGNGVDGITLADSSSQSDIAVNRIQGNLRNGLRIVSGEKNSIERTRFFRNRFLGIELSPQGVTANDWKDGDEGANLLQNFPYLQWARENADSNAVHVIGSLAGKSNTEYRLEFFANSLCHDSGHGEAEDLWVDDVRLTTDGSGYLAFDLWLDLIVIGARPNYMSATATDPNGNTSEFSNCLAVLPPPPPPADGVPFVINSTGDLGDTTPGDGICSTGGTVGAQMECTLRAAIEETNALTGEETVLFDIPDTALVIIPASPLPTISGPVQFNAQTQPGFIGDPIVALDGVLAGTTPGLLFQGSSVDVRGLIIHGFEGDGVSLEELGGHVVEGNVIGPNLGNGVLVSSDGNRIGRPGRVQGNLITGNEGDGIRIAGGSGNALTNNSLRNNGALGINLVGGVEDSFGVTEEDAGDGDVGPNGLQNSPQLTSVQVSDTAILVEGSLTSFPNQDFEVALYASSGCDPSEFGEGETYLGSLRVTTDAAGSADFSAELGLEFSGSDPDELDMATITATATNSENSTSEFGPCFSSIRVPVLLLYFVAQSEFDGVTVQWQMAASIEYLGFHLSRRLVGDVEWTRITGDVLFGDLAFEYRDTDGSADHEYLLEGVTGTGEIESFGPISVQEGTPGRVMFRVLPNPISGTGRVLFSLPHSGRVDLGVYDVLGRLVRSLAEGPYPAGNFELTWDGRDNQERLQESGVYWIRLRAPGATRTSRVVLMR